MSIELRLGRAPDAEKAAEILHEFHSSTGWIAQYDDLPETLKFCAIMIARGWMTVASLNGKFAGFLAKENNYVHALYVRSCARGQGIGHRLLRHAQMQEMSLDLWTFQRNHAAHRFYMREGFQATERTDGLHNDGGLPDVRFQWARGALL
ncbi:GNAT family N-acetyltransferase [Cognatishimia sp. WU-CL00825]|uniref:GNAT family N-acetyltransferase n=1 Tax=Cognatishimia sp. WU-CL00825 TaxID=3127658 RepID=UPI003109B9CB